MLEYVIQTSDSLTAINGGINGVAVTKGTKVGVGVGKIELPGVEMYLVTRTPKMMPKIIMTIMRIVKNRFEFLGGFWIGSLVGLANGRGTGAITCSGTSLVWVG